MIAFIDIPTERTTAFTDGILAVQTGIMSILLIANPLLHVFKGWLWIGAFAGIFLTAVFGTVAHGFKMDKRTNTILWQILTGLFSFCYVLIFTSIVYDLFGITAGKAALVICSLLGALLVAFCLRFPDFVPKIIYIGVGLGVLILGAVVWLGFVVKSPGALFLLAGMALASIATVVEARQKFRLKLIWEFDHHTGYHFFQFLGNFCMFFATTTFFAA